MKNTQNQRCGAGSGAGKIDRLHNAAQNAAKFTSFAFGTHTSGSNFYKFLFS